MGESLSFLEIIKIVKKRLLLIITLIGISIGIGAVLCFYILTPIFQAQTQLLVNQKNNPELAYAWQTTETDLRLINTYNVIITSPVILTPVIEELELDLTLEELIARISVSNESESKVVNISVMDSDLRQAVEISNTIAEVFKEQIPKLMSVDNITILSAAKSSDNSRPVKPDKLLIISIAGITGLMLGIGLAFLFEVLDTTFKNEQDIEEILGLPIIGIIDSIVEKKEKKYSPISRRVRRN